MEGLMYLLAFAVYLLISWGVVALVMAWAKKRGRSRWHWGLLAAFVMYNLAFWDVLPTYLLHQYYCATKAGFWVYKTAEQWKAENPGVAGTLTWKSSSPHFSNLDGSFGFKLNERFIWEIRPQHSLLLPVSTDTESIIDIKTGDAMVRQVSIGSGYRLKDGWQQIKSWVGASACLPKEKELLQNMHTFKEMGRQTK